MGIFDFVKDVGTNLFGDDEEERKKAEAAAAAAAAKAASGEEGRRLLEEANNAMLAQRLILLVGGLELKVNDLTVRFVDGTAIVAGKTRSQAMREKVILAIGNSQGVGRVDDRIEVEPLFHVVEKGDTLSKISQKHYGDPMKYETIFEANKPMLQHPDRIYPGQSLRIPELSG